MSACCSQFLVFSLNNTEVNKGHESTIFLCPNKKKNKKKEKSKEKLRDNWSYGGLFVEV